MSTPMVVLLVVSFVVVPLAAMGFELYRAGKAPE